MGNALFRRRAVIVKEDTGCRRFLSPSRAPGKDSHLAGMGSNPCREWPGSLGPTSVPNTERHSHGHAITGYLRLWARGDSKNASCLQEYTHSAATGSPDDIARQRCLSAGCDDFISKPFSISVLERCLTNLVSAKTPKTIVVTGLARNCDLIGREDSSDLDRW